MRILIILTMGAILFVSCASPVPPPTIAPTPIPTPTAMPTNQVIIGVWDYVLFASNKAIITIYSEDGALKAREAFYDGSKRVLTLSERQSPGGRRFDYPSGGGDYYVLNQKGDLEIWDKDGLIRTATRRSN